MSRRLECLFSVDNPEGLSGTLNVVAPGAIPGSEFVPPNREKAYDAQGFFRTGCGSHSCEYGFCEHLWDCSRHRSRPTASTRSRCDGDAEGEVVRLGQECEHEQQR